MREPDEEAGLSAFSPLSLEWSAPPPPFSPVDLSSSGGIATSQADIMVFTNAA
jgi:hypothetical protein